MIYRVVLDDTIDLHTSDINCMLLNPSLDLEMNSAGSFNFTLPPSHPYWDAVKVLKSTIDVYEDEDLIFTGRIASIEKNWNNERVVQCEGALAYFNDSVHRQMKWETPLPIASEDPTVHNFLKDILDNHNVFEGAENANRHIFIGNITVDPEVVTREVNYDTTLDILTRMCIDTNGGYMSIRKDLNDGKLYLDWIKDFTEESGQPAQFGLNLLNFDTSLSAEDICTGVLARGAEVNEQTVMLNDVELVDETTYPDMSVTHYTTQYQDILWHREGVEKFGQVVQVHDFSDAQTAWKDGQGQIVANSLFEMAKKWLEEKNTKIETIEVEVAELAWLGEGMPKYKLGQIVELSDDIHMAGESYETRLLPMYKLSCDLNSGSKKVTLGTPPKKELTQISASNSDSSTLSSSGSSSGSGGSGGGEECRVHDVKVDGTSVVSNKVANINLTGKADASTVTALANVVATKANTSDVNQALAQKQNTLTFNSQDAATAHLTKIKNGNDVYDIPTGTEVVANPTGTATSDLTKLKVGSDIYGIPSVVANPSGPATNDLETIQIGNTVYDIPGGGSGGEPGLNVIETYGSAGSKSYTITKAGLYAIFATVTYQGSCTITLPNDAITLFNNDLTVSSRISKYLIVELTANSTVTISMSVSQWLGCCSGVIALKNMEINQVADSVSKADTTASLTLPDDDKMYLVLATCAARSSSDARDNTTGGNPKYDEKVNPSSLSKLHLSLCKGSDSPTYSMYAYDGGIASVIAYELKKDLVYVEANPEGQATEDLDTILIDDTIYKLKGSGGDGQSYVCDVLFDTPTTTSTWSNPIEICTEAKAKEYDMLHILSSTYTGEPVAETILVDALGDTSTPFYIVSPRTDVNVNGVQGFIFLAFDSGKLNFYTGTGNSVTLVKVYGLKFASNVVNNNYLSDYYSTEERVVGRWTDGKPLYQKTIITTNTTVNNWVRIDVSSLNVDSLCNLDGQFTRYVNSKDYWYNFVGAESLYDSNYAGVLRFDFENSCGEITYRINIEATNKQVFTIQYTKSTDTAGTGPTPGNLIYLPALYSEEEREVGVWTDGKPLYQKTVIFTSLTQNGWNNKAHNVANIDKVVYCVGGVSTDDGQTNYYGSGANNAYSLLAAASVTYVNIYVGNYAFKKAIVTFQYTKTTDQPGSGRYLPDGQYSHHHSTSEKVVGTWIDGSTVYERTWDFGSEITINSQTWVDTPIKLSDYNIGFCTSIVSAINASKNCIWNFISASTDRGASQYVRLWSARSSQITIRYLTLQYTKSS